MSKPLLNLVLQTLDPCLQQLAFEIFDQVHPADSFSLNRDVASEHLVCSKERKESSRSPTSFFRIETENEEPSRNQHFPATTSPNTSCFSSDASYISNVSSNSISSNASLLPKKIEELLDMLLFESCDGYTQLVSKRCEKVIPVSRANNSKKFISKHCMEPVDIQQGKTRAPHYDSNPENRKPKCTTSPKHLLDKEAQKNRTVSEQLRPVRLQWKEDSHEARALEFEDLESIRKRADFVMQRLSDTDKLIQEAHPEITLRDSSPQQAAVYRKKEDSLESWGINSDGLEELRKKSSPGMGALKAADKNAAMSSLSSFRNYPVLRLPIDPTLEWHEDSDSSWPLLTEQEANKDLSPAKEEINSKSLRSDNEKSVNTPVKEPCFKSSQRCRSNSDTPEGISSRQKSLHSSRSLSLTPTTRPRSQGFHLSEYKKKLFFMNEKDHTRAIQAFLGVQKHFNVDRCCDQEKQRWLLKQQKSVQTYHQAPSPKRAQTQQTQSSLARRSVNAQLFIGQRQNR